MVVCGWDQCLRSWSKIWIWGPVAGRGSVSGSGFEGGWAQGGGDLRSWSESEVVVQGLGLGSCLESGVRNVIRVWRQVSDSVQGQGSGVIATVGDPSPWDHVLQWQSGVTAMGLSWSLGSEL